MDVAPDRFLIEGAKVFDGHRFLPRGALLVIEGRVAALDVRLTPPAGTPVVPAHGATVLPGLIDAHVHVFPGALQAALRCGVTTVLDMFADPTSSVRSSSRRRPTPALPTSALPVPAPLLPVATRPRWSRGACWRRSPPSRDRRTPRVSSRPGS